MLVVTVTGEIPAGVNYLELMLESSKADWAHEELRSIVTVTQLYCRMLKLNEFGLCWVLVVNYNITGGETFLGLEQAAELEEDLKCIKTFDSAKDFL